MKRILTILFLFFLLGMQCHSQKGYSRFHKNQIYEANSLFAMEDYYMAYELYSEIYPIDTSFADINAKMGICLFNMYDKKKEAFKYLFAASHYGNTESMFYLARLYLRNEEFESASQLLREYNTRSERLKPVQEIDYYFNQIENAKKAYSHPGEAFIKKFDAGINSSYQDYAPIIDQEKNKMYFTSRRPLFEDDKMDLTGQYFENIFSVDMPKCREVNSVGIPLNTANNDAAVSLSVNGNYMLIYRTDKQLTGGDLYLTEAIGDTWTEPEKLSSKVNSHYQEASAAFASDENTLYFSSNRPDGFGGKDIYRVKKLPNGEWSLPQNLGPVINTPYNEDAPFVNDEGELFFSSEGHNGIGGYDIFKSEKSAIGWSPPQNLGYPINTTCDDIYYSEDKEGKFAYFSSDRKGGMGVQDIYKVDLMANATVVVKGLITSNTGENQPVATITVINSSTKLTEGVFNSNPITGKFILALIANRNYTIQVESRGYQTITEHRNYSIDGGKTVAELKEVFNLAESKE